MLKNIIYILVLVSVFALGVILTRWMYQDQQEAITRSQSTVLLEKVQKVCKLVTVEGNFSELYDETNIRQFTLYLPLPTTWNFSKKAIIQVKGKVLVGYDMEKISISADSLHKRIVLSNLPQPEILSIDHELSYKNLEESYFNSFTPEDYTRLNQNAKAVLAQKAKESRLLLEAEQQGNQILDVIRFMAEAVGWEVVYPQPLEIGPLTPDTSFVE